MTQRDKLRNRDAFLFNLSLIEKILVMNDEPVFIVQIYDSRDYYMNIYIY